jgi:predicted DNA-binding antitoxin AbrB/MazE fold protein
MTLTVDAVYDGKVFLPIETIQLEPNTRVRLTIRSDGEFVTATEARRAANRAFLGDFVGTALSSATPIWSDGPQPHWKVPYHFFDGTLFVTISVDARSANVWLNAQERDALITRLAAALDARYAIT